RSGSGSPSNRITRAILPVPAMIVASASPSLKCRQLSRPGWSVSKAWWPCLMVAMRTPRRFSSAASATVSVVLPLFLRPTMHTAGGTSGAVIEAPGDEFGTVQVFARVDVEEEHVRIAEGPDRIQRDAHHRDSREQGPQRAVSGRQRAGGLGERGGGIPGAQRL